MNQAKFNRLAQQLNIKPHTDSYISASLVLIEGLSVKQAAEACEVSVQLVHNTVKRINATKVELTEVEVHLASKHFARAKEELDKLLED